ncbi:MAG: cysteine hydrolase [Chloroflexia bacterium]|nr:cysteine hydrolase [Chloroflexia bacterium]
MPTITNLTERAAPFLAYLEQWYASLPTIALAEVIGTHPERVMVLSVDMINGFCKAGPLSGPRVAALSEPVATLMQRAYALGVRNLVLTQDTHDPQAPEFAAYPPHCLAGTAESQTISELAALPFADEMTVIAKNSLSSHLGTTFQAWLDQRPELETFIVVGDCTDLCVYSAAMHLRLEANALNRQRRVLVAAATVDTFDTPVEVAHQLGIMAHDGDLHHLLFLHHMAQNGVEVIAAVR